MADLVQFRRGTAKRWSEVNPVLAEGEMGLILDSPREYKIGDGVHRWNDLPKAGFDGNITHGRGHNTNTVMSQDAVTKELEKIDSVNKKVDSDLASHVVEMDRLHDEVADLSHYVDGNIGYQDLSQTARQIIEAKGGGTITNLPDDDDLETFVDPEGINRLREKSLKVYAPTQYSGMGKVILRKNMDIGKDGTRKNILTKDMMEKENTIYIIRYDFDLNEEEITVPNDCVLKFEGGSFKNGTLEGKNTNIKSDDHYILRRIKLSGSWKNIWLFNWFFSSRNIASIDDVPDVSDELINLISYLKSIEAPKIIRFSAGVYKISKKIELITGLKIIGEGSYSPYDIIRWDEGSKKFDEIKNLSTLFLSSVTNDATFGCEVYSKENRKLSYKERFYMQYTDFEKNYNAPDTSGIWIENISIVGLNHNKIGLDICGPNSNIKNVFVYKFLTGIFLNYLWNSSLENSYIKSYHYGVVIGYSTEMTLKEITCLTMYKKVELLDENSFIKSGELINEKDGSNLYSVGILTHNTVLTTISGSVERFDVGHYAIKSRTYFVNIYMENISKTLISTRHSNVYLYNMIGAQPRFVSDSSYFTNCQDDNIYISGQALAGNSKFRTNKEFPINGDIFESPFHTSDVLAVTGWETENRLRYFYKYGEYNKDYVFVNSFNDPIRQTYKGTSIADAISLMDFISRYKGENGYSNDSNLFNGYPYDYKKVKTIFLCNDIEIPANFDKKLALHNIQIVGITDSSDYSKRKKIIINREEGLVVGDKYLNTKCLFFNLEIIAKGKQIFQSSVSLYTTIILNKCKITGNNSFLVKNNIYTPKFDLHLNMCEEIGILGTFSNKIYDHSYSFNYNNCNAYRNGIPEISDYFSNTMQIPQNLSNAYLGKTIYSEIYGSLYFTENGWKKHVDSLVNIDVLTEGTWAEAKAIVGIKQGFRFFCTDKGKGSGLFIYYTANERKEWIDGAGNVITD